MATSTDNSIRIGSETIHHVRSIDCSLDLVSSGNRCLTITLSFDLAPWASEKTTVAHKEMLLFLDRDTEIPHWISELIAKG